HISLPITLQTLASFNAHVNSILHYLAEPRGADVWQSPKQTWDARCGDCEDIAIAKYGALLEAGAHEPALALNIGFIKSITVQSGHIDHAWLAIQLSGTWYALD